MTSGWPPARWLAAAASNGSAVLAAVLVTTIVAGSCSRDIGDASRASVATNSAMIEPPPLDQVCSLLTRAEVERALGEKVVGEPQEPPPPKLGVIGMRECQFGDPEKGGTVKIGLASTLAPQVFKKAVTKLKGDAIASEPVRNLGDEALAFYGGFLLVRQGAHVLFVGVSPSGRPATDRISAAPRDTRERYSTLALKALERLAKRRRAT